MSFAHTSTASPRRLAVLAASSLALASLAVVGPTSTASAATQPVDVVTSVNGVVNGATYAGDTTTVSFAVTNRSTTGAKLGAFSIVVPPGLGAVTKGGPGLAGVTAPGTWGETIVPCGNQANCSAIVFVYASLPLSKSLVGPGATVIASITVKAPSTAGIVKFPLIGIGNGLFTSATTPSITVLDGSAAVLAVSSPPTVAGAPSTITVQSLNASNQVVPFKGGPVTLTLGTDDGPALINGQLLPAQPAAVPPVPQGRTITLTVPANSGTFSFPATFFTAANQGVVADAGALRGTSAPFIVSAAPASALRIDSVADTSGLSTDTKPVQGQTFAVGFSALDAYGNLATSSSVTASLTSSNATVSGGTLSASPVTTTTGTDTFSAVFSRQQTGLNLTVSAPGLTSAVTTTDVASGATILNPLGPVGDATAVLPNGSFGAVSFTSDACVLGVDLGCGTGTEYTLAGVFTNPDNPADHLYDNDHPAALTWTCSTGANCLHGPPPGGSTTAARSPEGEGSTNYLYNSGTDSDLNEQEQVEDFHWFPIYVALRTGTDGNGAPTYGPFGLAGACSPFVSVAANRITGRIVNSAAKTAGYCVDVYAISRAGNSFSGALTLPILFVEDPKMRP